MSNAAGETLGDAYVNVLANTDMLGPGLEKVKGMVTGSLKHIGTSLLGLVGVGLTVHSTLHNMMGAIEKGNALYNLSNQTGVAVKDLVVLQQAFKEAGASAEMVPRSIMKMQQFLAKGKSGATLKEMGLDAKSLQGMGAEAQFEKIGKGLNSIADPAERTAVAMKIFGRGGYMLKGLFSDPAAFEKAKEALGSLPTVMAKAAAGFHAFDKAVDAMKTKMQGMWAGIVVGMAPAMGAATKFMESFDFAKIGVNIGVFIRTMQLAFKGGDLGKILFLSLQIGAIKALNFMIKGFALIGVVVEEALKFLSNPSFWIGIGKLCLAGFQAIGGALLEIFAKPFAWIETKLKQLKWQFVGYAKPEDGAAHLRLQHRTDEYSTENMTKDMRGKSQQEREDEADRRRAAIGAEKGWEFDFKRQMDIATMGNKALGAQWQEDSGKSSNEGVNMLAALKPQANEAIGAVRKAFDESLKKDGLFSTKLQESALNDIIAPHKQRALKEYNLLAQKGGEKPGDKVKEEKGGGAFVAFTDAVKNIQKESAAEKNASDQRKEQIGLLTNINEGVHMQQAIFTGEAQGA